jgi:predicted aspartyl protease
MGYIKQKEMIHKFVWELNNIFADAYARTGTIPIFNIPANSKVINVEALVDTAITGSTAEILGDGDDDNGYLVDAFAASTGLKQADGAYMIGVHDVALDVDTRKDDKIYLSADTIDFKITGNATAGKVTFFVTFVRY